MTRFFVFSFDHHDEYLCIDQVDSTTDEDAFESILSDPPECCGVVHCPKSNS